MLSFGVIFELPVKSVLEASKITQRSKRDVVGSLKMALGGYRIEEITHPTLLESGKKRAKQGAGQATLALIFLLDTDHSRGRRPWHFIFPEQAKLARVALIRLGLVFNPPQRNGRPSQRDLDDPIKYFDKKANHPIPMSQIIRFD